MESLSQAIDWENEDNVSLSSNGAADLIELLTGASDSVVRFRCIPCNLLGTNNRNPKILSGTLPEVSAKLQRLNTEGYNIYLIINEGGDADDEIKLIRACFIDGDGIPLPVGWHVIPDLIYARDDHHWHAYWAVKDCPVSEFKAAQQQLARFYKTDASVCNPSRLMRLPDTLHWKDDGLPDEARPIYTLRFKRDDCFLMSEMAVRKSGLLIGLLPVKILPNANSSRAPGAPVPIDHLAELLSWIDPNQPRCDWIRIIAGVRATPLTDDEDLTRRLGLVCQWSRGDLDRKARYLDEAPSRYTSDDDVELVFNTMPPKEGGVGYGTVLKAARDGGYTGPLITTAEELFGAFAEEAANDDEAIEPWVAEVNKQFAFVMHGTKPRVAEINGKETLRFMTCEDFSKMMQNRWAPAKDGAPPKKLGPAWLSHPQRRQYLKGVVFAPGQKARAGELNLWRGHAVEAIQGDWSLMKDHLLRVICASDKQRYRWLLNWCATAIQKQDRPLGIVFVMRGAQGAGKGVFAENLGKLFAPNYLHLINPRELTGTFNASLATTSFVFLDEAVWAGDKQSEGTLKALITETTFRAEQKFMDPITVPNRLRIMMASNDKWVAPVGVEDRRFCVFDVSSIACGDRKHFNALIHQMDHGGLEAMMYELSTMDILNFDVRDIPQTAARSEQITRSLSGTNLWLFEVLSEGAIAGTDWEEAGVAIRKERAYEDYIQSDKRAYRPDGKSIWAKAIYEMLPGCVREHKPRQDGLRPKELFFSPLAECRQKFEKSLGMRAGGLWGLDDLDDI